MIGAKPKSAKVPRGAGVLFSGLVQPRETASSKSAALHLIHILDPLVRHHSHHLRFLSRFKFGQIAAGTCAVSSNRLHVCMLQHTGFASDRKPQSAVWISVGRSWKCASGEKHIRLIPTVSFYICFRLEFFLFFLV